MTWLLTVDPGLNTGIALGFYGPMTPYQLHHRWQVHRGVDGFLDWRERVLPTIGVDEIVYEKFLYDPEADGADLAGVPIEGVLAVIAREARIPLIEQNRTHKGSLTGYPPEARTKAQRQRVRFDFLERHGMFIAGTENDDSHDAITHALVFLKGIRHAPTIRRFWPPRQRPA